MVMNSAQTPSSPSRYVKTPPGQPAASDQSRSKKTSSGTNRTKVILGGLLFTLVSVGTAAALYLSGTNQDIRQQASQTSWPDSCQVPKGQTEGGQGCDMQIDEIPQCPGQGYGWYWREIIDEDDDGSIAHGDEMIFEVPDDSQTYTGMSIRMHDHEENMCFTIEGSADGQNWQEFRSGEIHTSGSECSYDCSENTEPNPPPGDQGCPDPVPEPGPENEWFHEPYEEWHNRANWPCAVSFDEHYIEFDGSNNYQYIKLKVRNCEGHDDDQHIHVYDVLWQKCGEPPISNTPAPPGKTWTFSAACPDGTIPQNTDLRMFVIESPAGGTQRCTTQSLEPGSNAMEILSDYLSTELYFGVELPTFNGQPADCSQGTTYEPLSIEPATDQVEFGRFMNPDKWMVKFERSTLDQGSYLVKFDLPAEFCQDPPECQDITVSLANDDPVPDTDNIQPGTSLKFICSASSPDRIDRYEFRVINPNEEIVEIQAETQTRNVSQTYTIPTEGNVTGTYTAECRLCPAGEECQGWQFASTIIDPDPDPDDDIKPGEDIPERPISPGQEDQPME